MKKIIFFFYTIFLFFFSFFSYAFVDPKILKLSGILADFSFSHRLLTTALYILLVIFFFIFYGVFFYISIKKNFKFKDILLVISITVGVLFFSYPAFLSYDIFNYIASAKVLFFYQENPYIVMPIHFAHDELFSFMHAANKIALYGPTWILLSGIPHLVGFNNFILTLFSFKLFVILFYFALSFLIYWMTKSLTSFLIFALNPLVLVETVMSGHNDVVMMFFVLLSFYFLKKKNFFFAVLLFVASIFVKYATILLLPIFTYIILISFVKKKSINWDRIFYFSTVLMMIGFAASPIREEIYPWYAIWFLVFVSMTPSSKLLLYISLALSFGLLLRNVPFILTGTHAQNTPLVKTIVTFVPPFMVVFFYFIKDKLWLKMSSR